MLMKKKSRSKLPRIKLILRSLFKRLPVKYRETPKTKKSKMLLS